MSARRILVKDWPKRSRHRSGAGLRLRNYRAWAAACSRAISPPDIFLVYPEGNYIRASDDRPFLQIGESKYGKFLLDVAILAHTDLVTSTKIALGSMMSTARANLSVGPPYDTAVYRSGTFALDEHRFAAGSPVLEQLREVWERNILHAVAELPDVELGDAGG